jgi:pimeloyl-ACP methyl ester carboxylesterase
MIYHEYGKEHNDIIVFLHGASMVHTFRRQYELADRYHLYVPHIAGFGDHTDVTFEARAAITELAEFIRGLDKKVFLVGFSLGAQLAFALVSDYPELFNGAIIASPWLIKEESILAKVMNVNLKNLKGMHNRRLCSFVAILNGLTNKKLRKEFVEQNQHVSEATIRNVVDNGITIDKYPGFKSADFPVLALAGGREYAAVTDSVKKLEEINSNCRAEVWEGAKHNIPWAYAERFNETIVKMC